MLVEAPALALGMAPGLAASASAAPTDATTLALDAPVSGKAGLAVPFEMVLSDAEGGPLAGAEVVLERLAGQWVRAGSGTSDAAGRLVVRAAPPAGTTSWRASYAGDGTHPAALSSASVEVTSKRLRGADDYASMRADNTSGFNCRQVVNRPGVLSPHARGRSIDINPWENPYRSATGLVPNSWWASRSHPKIARRSSSHPVVEIWRADGFRWTYGTGDSHHYDGRTVPTAGGFGG